MMTVTRDRFNEIQALENENRQLKEDKAKLAEKMLNVIGIVSLVSDDAYRCIHKDFIAELKELDK